MPVATPRRRSTPPRPGLIAVCMATFEPDTGAVRDADRVAAGARPTPSWVCVLSDDCSSPERFEAIERRARRGPPLRARARRPAARLLPQLRARARPRAARGRADRAVRPGRPLAPGQARRAARRARRRAASCTPTSGWSTPAGSVLREHDVGGPAQQPHGPRLAARREHRHGRRDAVPPRGRRARAAVPGRARAGSSTTTGSGSSRSPAGDVAYVDRPLYDYVQHRGRGLRRGVVAAAGAGVRRRLARRRAAPTSSATSRASCRRRRCSPAAVSG